MHPHIALFTLVSSIIPLSLSLSVGMNNKLGGLSNNGKIIDTKQGKPADWHHCKAQGNFPDSTTCDHYIACTAALKAFQMPCQTGHDGRRLWYARDSGPVQAESYCDFPEEVECDIDGHGEVEHDDIGEEAATDNNASCQEMGAEEGKACDHKIDCKQCGYCDWYLRCDKDEGKWIKSHCDYKEKNGTVFLDSKTFWNPVVTMHGGQCNLYEDLPEDIKQTYVKDTACKPICGYVGDKNCDRKYFYIDPSLEDGVWSPAPKELLCPNKLVWNQNELQCTFCPEGKNCKTNC